MNATDLEDRLRSALHAEAERAPLRSPEWDGGQILRRAERPRRHSRLAALGPVAACLLIVIGVTYVAVRERDDGSPRRGVVTDDTTTTALQPPSTTAPLPSTPARASVGTDLWVPTGPGVAITSFGRDDFPVAQATNLSVWVRCAACDRPTAAFAVEERDDGRSLPGLSGAADYEVLDQVLDAGVTEARIAREVPYLGGVTVLDVRQGEDDGFVVIGWGDEADLLAVARAQLGAAPLPDGIELVWRGEATSDSVSPVPAAAGSVKTGVQVRVATGETVFLNAHEANGVPLAATTAFLRQATPVTVGGHRGLAMTNDANALVVWKPDADTTLTLNGAIGLDTALAIAEEVDRLPRERWEPLASEALADLQSFEPGTQPRLPDGSPDCEAFVTEQAELLANGVTGGGHLLCATVDRSEGPWNVRVYVDGQPVYAMASRSACVDFRTGGFSTYTITRGGLVEPRGVAVDETILVGTAPAGTRRVTLTFADGSRQEVDAITPRIDGAWSFFATFGPTPYPTVVYDPPPPSASSPPPAC
jgi:hypothetical protein